MEAEEDSEMRLGAYQPYGIVGIFQVLSDQARVIMLEQRQQPDVWTLVNACKRFIAAQEPPRRDLITRHSTFENCHLVKDFVPIKGIGRGFPH